MSSNRIGIAKFEDRNYIKKNGYQKNYVSKLIIDSLISGGLGKIDKEAPMKDIVRENNTVLLKPNWVNHINFSNHGIDCLITNEIFIECVIEEVIKCKPKFIIIGDSPIQSCNFDRISNWAWLNKIKEKTNIPIILKDYRRTHFYRDPITLKTIIKENIVDESEYILFDLGCYSSLEEITVDAPKFRIADYNHKLLNANHQKGIHKYLMTMDPFKVDVIINLPKLKIHQKAGLTGALKNLVGLNGNKDYLPHHRFGGSLEGGDCYHGKSILKKANEILNDYSNQYLGSYKYSLIKNISRIVTGIRLLLGVDGDVSGSWYGNDTVWRMTHDLNKILLYGCSDGTISDKIQRTIYTITDAIIAGHKDGPLKPEPIQLGIVTFGSTSCLLDFVHAKLMGLDANKIQLVSKSLLSNLKLSDYNFDEIEIFINSIKSNWEDLKKLKMDFIPAPGWKNYIELNRGI